MVLSSFLYRWYGLGVFLIVAMVAIGGTTRLTSSGLSMVDWKPLKGIIPPISNADWEQEFNNYKQFPEYQYLNKGFKNNKCFDFLHTNINEDQFLIDLNLLIKILLDK